MDGIYLKGNAYIQTLNGNINLWAANEVIVTGGRRQWANGIDRRWEHQRDDALRRCEHRRQSDSTISQAHLISTPFNHWFWRYCTVCTVPTSAASARRPEAMSPLPPAAMSPVIFPSNADNSGQSDGGTGAFGPQPGNVTITAGGNVSGHYVVANGTGAITAGQDVGSDRLQNVALSLVKGVGDAVAPAQCGETSIFRKCGIPTGCSIQPARLLVAFTSLITIRSPPVLDGGRRGLFDRGICREPAMRSAREPTICQSFCPHRCASAPVRAGSPREYISCCFPRRTANLQITTTDGGDFNSGAAAGLTYDPADVRQRPDPLVAKLHFGTRFSAAPIMATPQSNWATPIRW